MQHLVGSLRGRGWFQGPEILNREPCCRCQRVPQCGLQSDTVGHSTGARQVNWGLRLTVWVVLLQGFRGITVGFLPDLVSPEKVVGPSGHAARGLGLRISALASGLNDRRRCHIQNS